MKFYKYLYKSFVDFSTLFCFRSVFLPIFIWKDKLLLYFLLAKLNTIGLMNFYIFYWWQNILFFSFSSYIFSAVLTLVNGLVSSTKKKQFISILTHKLYTKTNKPIRIKTHQNHSNETITEQIRKICMLRFKQKNIYSITIKILIHVSIFVQKTFFFIYFFELREFPNKSSNNAKTLPFSSDLVEGLELGNWLLFVFYSRQKWHLVQLLWLYERVNRFILTCYSGTKMVQYSWLSHDCLIYPSWAISLLFLLFLLSVWYPH